MLGCKHLLKAYICPHCGETIHGWNNWMAHKQDCRLRKHKGKMVITTFTIEPELIKAFKVKAGDRKTSETLRTLIAKYMEP